MTRAIYEWRIEGSYGQGWEEVTAEDTAKEARARLKEYDYNEPQYVHRIKRVIVGREV